VDDEAERVNVEFLIVEGEGLVSVEVGEIPLRVKNEGGANGKKRGREDDDDGLRKKVRVEREQVEKVEEEEVDKVDKMGSSFEDGIVIEDDDTVMID
jgi:hypothetical protein